LPAAGSGLAALLLARDVESGEPAEVGRLRGDLAQDLPGRAAFGVDLRERQGAADLQVAVARSQELLEGLLARGALLVGAHGPEGQGRLDADPCRHRLVLAVRLDDLAHLGQHAVVERTVVAEQRDRRGAQLVVLRGRERFQQFEQVLAVGVVGFQALQRHCGGKPRGFGRRGRLAHERGAEAVEVFRRDVAELVADPVEVRDGRTGGVAQQRGDVLVEVLGGQQRGGGEHDGTATRRGEGQGQRCVQAWAPGSCGGRRGGQVGGGRTGDRRSPRGDARKPCRAAGRHRRRRHPSGAVAWSLLYVQRAGLPRAIFPASPRGV